MNMLDDPLVQQFLNNRDLSKSSQIKYERVLRYYSNFIGLTPNQFITEAENEEEERLRMRKRKITSYFIDFKQHLIEKEYKPQTIQMYLTGLKTFYADHDIELPRMRLRGVKKKEDINDIPSKENIREALKKSNPKYSAVILLMSSSGMGSSEIRGLKIKDLLNALKDHIKTPINRNFDVGVLSDIKGELINNINLIIPTWKNLRRQKTGVIFTTFSTPESLLYIIDYLELFPPKSIEDPIFRSEHHKNKPISPRAFHDYFNRLNKLCGFSSPNGQVLFRSHAVGRKYFATCLYRKGLPQLSIEWFLGHQIDSTTSAYYKQDITQLKEQYITCISELSIADTEIKSIKSPEFIQVENKMHELKEYNKKMEERMAAMERQLNRRERMDSYKEPED